MRKVIRKAMSLSIVLSLMLCMVGVVNLDASYAATKKIHLKKTTVTVVAGNTYQQKLYDKNGKTIKATKVKWKSLKTSVAKISKKGKITAVKAGTAKMTAKYKGKTYKFTVKVKKPFTSGQKPIITEVEYLNTDDEIYLEWKELKNAKEYQVYVSVNGGAFKLYEDTEYDSSYYGGVKKGRIYAFKVRAVCGKYKSAFSKVKKIKIPKASSDPTPTPDPEPTPEQTSPAETLYEYIMNNGYLVGDKQTIFGNKCIESDVSSSTTSQYIINKKCIISINTDKPNIIYFTNVEETIDLSASKTYRMDLTIEYNIGEESGLVSYYELASGFYRSATIDYSKYSGNTTFSLEDGLTDFSRGSEPLPLEDDLNEYYADKLAANTQTAIIGADKLINSVLGLRLRDLGFDKI